MKNLRTICEGAILVAASLVLAQFLEIRLGINGGSLSLAMIPLVVFALRRGPVYGIVAGTVFGLLNCILSGNIGWGLPSVLLDYVLAYGAVGVAGFFGRIKVGKVNLGPIVGSIAGCAARFAIHFLSGVTIYAITTATELNGVTYTNAALYSLIYNGSYMLPDTILTVVVVALVAAALEKTAYPLARVKEK